MGAGRTIDITRETIESDDDNLTHGNIDAVVIY